MIAKVYLGNIVTRIGNNQTSLETIAEVFDRDFAKSRHRAGVDKVCYFGENQDFIAESVDCAKESVKDLSIQGIFAAQCTPSSELLMPTYAACVSNELGLAGIAHTVNFGCAGIAYALLAARNQVLVDSLQGKNTSYLVVTGDHISRTLKDEWSTRALFSDAVASCVVSSNPLEYELNSANVKSLSSPNFNCMGVTSKDLSFYMDGKTTYGFVKSTVLPTFKELTPEINKDGIIIPHAASNMSLQALIASGDLPCDIYAEGLQSGNKQVASTLFGLEEVNGYEHVYLMPFGAELTVGSVSLKKIQ